MADKNSDFSYIRGTLLEKLIDSTVDGWAKILGFTEEKPKPKKMTKTKKKGTKK